ncbi:MAG: Uma2 family endonuclease [Synechococcaceae cyanobacterium SM1_2_3]|nr:Uma2 family endonuclease [Synechococcaceae cyanobacterium SM1_2_3]
MSAQLKPRWFSVEEYLAFEEASEIKHEYVNGEIYAMTGVSVRHNRISGNLFARLLNHLDGSRCEVFFAEVKLRLKELNQDIFYYPDLMVCCDPNDRDLYWRSRPCLIVEVLSNSTARIDRSEKYLTYIQLDSLQGYLLLEQNKIGATLYRRNGGGWQREEFNDPQTALTLPCAELTVQLAEIYAGTGLPEDSPPD